MFINKIGSEHLEAGINCQDFGFIKDNIKVIVDGCSEGSNSEVGAKLFCYMLQKDISCLEAFQNLKTIFPDYKDLRDFCCFTYFQTTENNDYWYLAYCGDGFIIKQRHDDTIEFEEITCGEYPEYFIYNFIEPEHLNKYKDGVTIKTKLYSKEEYKNIGIATDGLRYIFETHLEQQFINYFKNNKETALKRLINKNNGTSFVMLTDSLTKAEKIRMELSSCLKDDLTIAF